MIFYDRFVPGLAIVSYLIGDEKSGEAVVIDPTRDVGDFMEYARQHDLHIKHIIETHVHADFVCGSRELKARLNDEPQIYCSSYGGGDWRQPFADLQVKSGDALKMGDLCLEFRHVPGHTPEHIAVLLYDTTRSTESPWCMFTGDFLFVGDVGRPDLLGDEAKQELAHQLYQSLFQELNEVPDFTEIFPAHGAGSLCGKAIGSRRSSTLGYERRFSEALQKQDESAWIESLLDEMPLSPPYFKRMKQVNTEGPAIIGPELPGLKRWQAKQVHDRSCEGCLILDVRSKEAYAAAHIPGSINIPFGSNLPTWAGWVLPYDRPLMLVVDDASQVKEVVTHLLRVGFDDIQGYLEGGIVSWETAGLPLEMLETISINTLHKKIQQNYPLTILDVRTEQEWKSGHIKGAIHIHGGTLQDRFDEIPQEKPIAVVCGSGYRASIASSFIRHEGFDDVANVMGGMSAWKAADLPLTA
ncbi:MBL fold metallo-hydrolase [Gimesia fumaroli]|uniref:Beta-lactamase hydrolase-like protein n=1 Tax=Gimesia fumaroli TaxID=2527976 RepID=A0A518III2_9PLAN|nr:rhodanese-like domain-containing protein [Gimesia fumaroli]QDV52895.1 Beta-lactamase hydrolase-like protein [Gimesia fumaroli]